MADHPLRPATDRRLGRPLPHQLANPTSAAPIARGLSVPRFLPQDVCGISVTFATLSPTLGYVPIYYSPVRHSPPEQAPCCRSTCMCKACRQRSICARIKLFSLISVTLPFYWHRLATGRSLKKLTGHYFRSAYFIISCEHLIF